MKRQELAIKTYRKRFAIYAGGSRLSNLYKTEEEAKRELYVRGSFYRYWAGSISVSIENAPKKILKLDNKSTCL